LVEEAARPEKMKLHEGPVGCMDSFTEELVSFVKEWHGKGILVLRLCLIQKASDLSPVFANKTLCAQKTAISCFMAKNSLVHRMATHTAQSPPQEMCNKANGFLQEIVPIINNGNQLPPFTLNMDQTPVNHAMNPKDTINRRGTRTINLRTAGGDSRRVTVAITITVSGHQLPLLVVFKGKSIHLDTANTVTNIMVDCCVLIAGMPNGMIARREVPTLPAGSIYCLNEKAWFNEQIMHDWIEHVLAPYLAMAPPGLIPILFLDQFRVHKMGLIVNAIQALGVQVEFIPAGCTRLIQLVDVGFNKAFKCKMWDEFLKWMMMQDPNLPIPGSKRHEVARWIIDTQNNICAETIRNAWRKTGFSYYPKNQ
jgi:hypothetical protein